MIGCLLLGRVRIKIRDRVRVKVMFNVGIYHRSICRTFDILQVQFVLLYNQVPVRDRVFDVLLYFCSQEDEDIKCKALSGLGFLCNRHADFMLTTEVKDLYWKIMTDPEISVKLLCLVRT